jgi:hypothetical protein
MRITLIRSESHSQIFVVSFIENWHGRDGFPVWALALNLSRFGSSDSMSA